MLKEGDRWKPNQKQRQETEVYSSWLQIALITSEFFLDWNDFAKLLKSLIKTLPALRLISLDCKCKAVEHLLE